MWALEDVPSKIDLPSLENSSLFHPLFPRPEICWVYGRMSNVEKGSLS